MSEKSATNPNDPPHIYADNTRILITAALPLGPSELIMGSEA
jgi:hypothetical protein